MTDIFNKVLFKTTGVRKEMRNCSTARKRKTGSQGRGASREIKKYKVMKAFFFKKGR